MNRPDLHGEHPTWSRDSWRHEVASKDTQLGYWDWVMHRLVEHEEKDPSRQLPADVAFVTAPYDIYDMDGIYSDAARLAMLVHSMRSLSMEVNQPMKALATHMCVAEIEVERILQMAEDRYRQILKSIEQ